MSCENCTQKIIDEKNKKNKIIEQAQQLANENNAWFGLYIDEQGKETVARYEPGAYFYTQLFSPKLPNPDV